MREDGRDWHRGMNKNVYQKLLAIHQAGQTKIPTQQGLDYKNSKMWLYQHML